MSNPARISFVSGLIGKPWIANAKGPDAFDCWHLAKHVQVEMFGRDVPDVNVPEHPSWPWMISQFRDHDELSNWVEVLQIPGQPLAAEDGSICLMARHRQPAHCGVLLMPETLVLHCDQRTGVCLQDLMTLRMEGWAKLRFYSPR